MSLLNGGQENMTYNDIRWVKSFQELSYRQRLKVLSDTVQHLLQTYGEALLEAYRNERGENQLYRCHGALKALADLSEKTMTHLNMLALLEFNDNTAGELERWLSFSDLEEAQQKAREMVLEAIVTTNALELFTQETPVTNALLFLKQGYLRLLNALQEGQTPEEAVNTVLAQKVGWRCLEDVLAAPIATDQSAPDATGDTPDAPTGGL